VHITPVELTYSALSDPVGVDALAPQPLVRLAYDQGPTAMHRKSYSAPTTFRTRVIICTSREETVPCKEVREARSFMRSAIIVTRKRIRRRFVHMLTSLFRASLAAAALVVMAAVTAPVQAQETDMPPLTKQLNNGNWLPPNEAEALRDELFYQRAIYAYMTMLPALNTIGMRDGSEAVFGKGYHVLPIWKDRMDAGTWVPTPNGDVIYSMNYLDLKETGPLVVAAPRDVIGMFTDFFQRTITDVGLIGPDRARGGLYLLLPPEYDGEI